mmetsp:Transcript_88696/g.251459  ORF Transcript_88696/g.251459 Transcript_88696/m.251459 type:complete len:268 (-) Transcript_88696:105-908(-)
MGALLRQLLLATCSLRVGAFVPADVHSGPHVRVHPAVSSVVAGHKRDPFAVPPRGRPSIPTMSAAPSEDADKMRLLSARLLETMTSEGVEKLAPKRTADGQHWLALPVVFVLISAPSANTPTPLVYTLNEQKGFMDSGGGVKSPMYIDTLMVFEDISDAQRYSGLVEAQIATSLWAHEVAPRLAFVFAARQGMELSFVPRGSLLLPPRGGGEAGVRSSVARPWRPVETQLFDEAALQGAGGLAESFQADYEEERRKLDNIFGRPGGA